MVLALYLNDFRGGAILWSDEEKPQFVELSKLRGVYCERVEVGGTTEKPKKPLLPRSWPGVLRNDQKRQRGLPPTAYYPGLLALLVRHCPGVVPRFAG